MKISSINNLKIKELVKLQKRKLFRHKQHIILVEGKKEIQMALKNHKPHEIFLYKNICGVLSSIEDKFSLVIEITANIFKKLSYRGNSGGIIATFHSKKILIKEFQLPKNPIILILVGLEKPGNLGAILRSSESIGTDVIILSDIKTDLFHTNIIRSSLGTIFLHRVILSHFNEIIKWLKQKKIKILATYSKEYSINLYEIDLREGIAIIVGNESLGLSKNWINNSDELLKIPMYGNIDSLNVSNAVAIIIFEILRQRITNSF